MLTQLDLKAITKIIKTEIKSALNPVNKKLDIFIDYFDSKYLNHEKRINRVEHHLNISSLVD